MQTLKNKAFRVSIQWNALVRKLLSLERDALIEFDCLKARLIPHALKKFSCWIVGVGLVFLLNIL
ncbi:hypothetical protein HpBT236_09850 [Helicobacter pylori]